MCNKKNKHVQQKEPKKVNRDYICIRYDPINSINRLDPDDPSWNMDKVREGLASGLLRYATDDEIQEAKAKGVIVRD